MADPWISEGDIGAYLNRDLGGNAFAKVAAAAACDLIREYTGQRFYPKEENEVVIVDGPDAPVLVLPQLPVTAVGQVELLSGSTWTVLASTEYTLGANGLLHRRYQTWSADPQSIRVTYTHGYTAKTDVPASVRMIATQVAARIVDQGLVQSEAIGEDVSLTYWAREGASLTDNEKDALTSHRPLVWA